VEVDEQEKKEPRKKWEIGISHEHLFFAFALTVNFLNQHTKERIKKQREKIFEEIMIKSSQTEQHARLEAFRQNFFFLPELGYFAPPTCVTRWLSP